jgi:CheY-like chemotaxis protein
MGKRILIADDLSFIRMLQKEVLTAGVPDRRGGGQRAGGGGEVPSGPDVVLDITMPEMNGLAAMQQFWP